MNLLIHFILLAVFVNNSDPSLYKNLRENAIQLLNGPKAYVPRPPKEPSIGILRSDSLDRNRLRKKHLDRNLKEDSDGELDPYNALENRGMLADDVTVTTPKLKVVRRKRKKHKYSNDAAPLVNDKNAQMLRMAMPYKNEEDGQELRHLKDIEEAQSKAKIFKNAVQYENKLNSPDFPYSRAGMLGKQRYHMDPVLNIVRSPYRRKGLNTRRKKKHHDDDESSDESSDADKNWKEEWQQYWAKKKYDALNSTLPGGDTFNMVAGRPWGVHCGDPNQHDMPWGSCMLAVECEPEYRIYRGDMFCGRTEFVCCGIYLTNYDLYQGIDVSFEDKSLSTDTGEKKGAGDSNEKAKKKSAKQKEKRKRDRIKRKKQIKKNIRKIIKEIKKILDKQYKNGTKMRQNRTKLLKKFVKHLKKQYKKDRSSVKEIHEEQMMKIDAALQEKLNQIRAVNEEFMKNDTFRAIIINGTITPTAARMLIEAYPELTPFIHTRRNLGIPLSSDRSLNEEYDVEYGYLYY